MAPRVEDINRPAVGAVRRAAGMRRTGPTGDRMRGSREGMWETGGTGRGGGGEWRPRQEVPEEMWEEAGTGVGDTRTERPHARR